VNCKGIVMTLQAWTDPYEFRICGSRDCTERKI